MNFTLYKSIKKFFVGSPISSAEASQERLSKTQALATFSSDPISSVAYATEEIILVLMAAGTAALRLSLPISLAIVLLLFIVVVSYRQTIRAYPGGGGAYIVAKTNLGVSAGLTAGAALLTDYILTVAVSVAAGIAALTSAFPNLQPHATELCLVSILVITLMNLRGVRESSTIFAFPTYAFVVGILLMLVTALFKASTGRFDHVVPPNLPISHSLTLFLLLRAFSSGCTALTGVEAISNGVPLFRKPEASNAAKTMLIMVILAATMFIGISYFAWFHGIVPSETETVLSQLTRAVFGRTGPYYLLQFMTVGILILAANTSFADFPRLASLLATDRFLPRQLTARGDRLAFSNGILMLSLLSGLLVVLFHASTHALIPLYAVGVFLSFTLSQFGMVVHWRKTKGAHWLRQAWINAIGGGATAIVTVVFTATKFTRGAWVILIIIPLFIRTFQLVRKHYLSVGRQLSLSGIDPESIAARPLKHVVIIPISGMHRGIVNALRYAHSISTDVRAVYVEMATAATERMRSDLSKWGRGVVLIVLPSPYRSVLQPLLRYIQEVREGEREGVITVLVPEFINPKWWQTLMHNQTALVIRAALIFERNIVVTSVRYHLR